GRTRGQSPEVADEREARVQVEGKLSKTIGRARCAIECAAGASLRIPPLCRPPDLSGDGCAQKRWRHQARDVRSQSTRLPSGIFNRSYYEEVLIVRVHPEIIR